MEPVHIPTADEMRLGAILLIAQGTFLGTIAAALVQGAVRWVIDRLSTPLD